ncbi:MAG: Nif3-like dinuclear metal center hexameric protein [Mucilaginibacter sp.]
MTNLSVMLNRRKFITTSSAATGLFLATPLINKASVFIKPAETYTVRQIMDLFIKEIPGGSLSGTVDTLKSGSPDTVVTGIVTAMFATIDVIRKAIDLGANFIIVHEPTFYNHTDDTSWLQNDEVYQYKTALLKKHNIAVWRNHDYIHSLLPDGVTIGVLAQLNWLHYADKTIPNIITLPATTLKDIIGHAKDKLHIDKVRYIGNPEQSCTRVLFMPGSAGGRRQIESAAKVKPDVLICGEISEWETAEYVRDARAKGDNLSLIVLGHIASEDAGSEYMLGWLKKHIPAIKATRVRPGNSLSFM